MTVEYLDLNDYLATALEVTGWDLDMVLKVTNLDLADSALHAPQAGFGDTDRYPDFIDKALVDLVAIIRGASTDAADQGTALASEANRRDLTLPDRFTVPDLTLWEPGYQAEAERSLLPTARTLEDALAVVGPFIDPLLAGTASGRWNPATGRWI